MNAKENTGGFQPLRIVSSVFGLSGPVSRRFYLIGCRPPHLQHSFRSVQGEFELIELEDGRTKLIGRTWYTIDMGPRIYWRKWTDEIIHQIHLRVLNHIKENAEQ